jgi:hypothetical protein
MNNKGGAPLGIVGTPGGQVVPNNTKQKRRWCFEAPAPFFIILY